MQGGLTPTLHEAVVLVGTAQSFRPGSALLERLLKVRVPSETVRRLTEQAGAALAGVEDRTSARIARTFPAVPAGPAWQLVSVDGVMVPLVGGEWREVKLMALGAIRCYRDRTKPSKTQQISYFARLADAATFIELAAAELHRRGTERATLVAAVADGASWCQQFFDAHLTNPVRILDFAHAVEHLTSAAQATFGMGSEATKTWVATQAHTLRHGDPGQVVQAIAALPVETAPDRAAATQERDRQQAYFTTRLPQLAYARFAAQGLPIGSGTVESGNKLVVERRLKGPGMHWSPARVDAMLALRTALASERWDEVWSTIADQLRHHYQGRAPRPACPTPPPPLPPPITTVRRSEPRPKTIIDGRPTSDHPWKRRVHSLPIPSLPDSISKT